MGDTETPQISVEPGESDAEIANPERGYYTGLDLLSPSGAVSLRERGYTLAHALVRLDDYRDQPLSPDFLDRLEDGFAAVRAAGVKVILRFSYNASFARDASKAQIIAHIAQLQPVLANNTDVIAVVQAGFIGAWGEWHSSESGLDNDADRAEVLEALLAALPPHRAVQVRTPMFKQAAFGDAVSEPEAFDGSHRSRVGHHNDCFLASESDLGTYAQPVADWRTYLEGDSQYVPVGGETCSLNAPRTDCGSAIDELSGYHWSYLNHDYKRAVIDSWDADGCGDEIRRRLGYRLAAVRVTHSEVVQAGGRLSIEIELANRGFASMFNERPAFVVLIRGEKRVALRLEELDPRRLGAGETQTIGARLELPAELASGEYRLALWLPDADPSLADDSRYAVQLANDGAWDSATGDNVLSSVRVEVP